MGYTQAKKELEWVEWESKQLIDEREDAKKRYLREHPDEPSNCPKDKRPLQHRFNGGQKTFVRYKNTRYPVDGWDPETKTVYQFHGCRYHGHRFKIAEDAEAEIQAALQQRAAQQAQDQQVDGEGQIADLPDDVFEANLRADQNIRPCRHDNEPDEAIARLRWEQTVEITRYLREDLGLTVIEKWECEWDREKFRNNDIALFREQYFNLQTKERELTGQQLIERVEEGSFCGLVEVDIEVVPWNLQAREKFADIPPIFKHASISKDDIGDFMKEYAEQNNLMRKPRDALISSYFGKKILLTTPLLKWYLKHGLQVSRVYQAVEYMPQACFEHLGEEVADARRAADTHPALKPRGEMFKTEGNSYYGKTITDLLKHIEVQFLNAHKFGFAVNDPRYRGHTQIGENAFEVEMAKRKIVFNLPIIIGFFVYCYAKMRMLEFYYDFLAKWVAPEFFEPIEMDTDSMYFSFAYRSLDEFARDHVRQEQMEMWLADKEEFIADEGDDYRKREPGLFKLEWSGDSMCCLNSKTYICGKHQLDPVTNRVTTAVEKTSTKGVSKTTNDFSFRDFTSVICSKESVRGTNHSLRAMENKVVYTEQDRDGLAFLYYKRKVLSDRVSTEPLEI